MIKTVELLQNLTGMLLQCVVVEENVWKEGRLSDGVEGQMVLIGSPFLKQFPKCSVICFGFHV